MANAIEDAFDTVASGQSWERAFLTFGAFLAPTVVRNVVEGNTGLDLPDELYGIGVMAGSSYAGQYKTEVMIGSGVYTADKLAERVGVKQTVSQLGA